MSEVVKGKGETRGKNGKTGKCAKKQDNESTYSFQNYDSWWLLTFLYRGWYLHEKKGNLVFSIMYGKFWFDSDFFVRNLDASLELQSLPQRDIFLFLTEW